MQVSPHPRALTRALGPVLVFVALCLSTAGASAQPPGFPSAANIINEMRTAAQNYPQICQLVDLTTKYGTPKTHLGNNIFAVRISDNVTVEEDEPSFMMVCAHHGNEYGTPIVGLDAIARLTRGYASDPTIKSLVDNNEIWIAPLWNVDGYHTSRHNRRPGGTVDLNRNYPFLWGSPCNTGVKGPSPGSEPETKTMIAWSEDQRFTKVLDFHSSGRETLYAYRQSCPNHQLTGYLRNEASLIAQNSGYGGQVRGPSSNGEHYQWQLGNFSNYAFLTEISNTQSPTRASADAEAATVWPGTVWILRRPIPVQGHVTDAVTGAPIEANISYVQNPFTQGERNRSEPRFGRYHAFLPAGAHTLRFARPGYVTQDVPVTVTAAGAQVEVKLMPFDGLRFALPTGAPATLDAAGGTTVRVQVLASGTVMPMGNSGLLHVRSANGEQVLPMLEVTPHVYDAELPGGRCGDTARFWFSAADTTGRRWVHPPTAPGTPLRALYRTGSRTITTVTFETPTGWVGGVAGDTATTGRWNRMDPEPTAAQPDDDHTPTPGTICWVTDGRAGSSIGSFDIDGGFTTLLSPNFDLSQRPNALLGYWRWFSNNRNSARDDVLRVDISNDGGATWTNVETVGPTGRQTEGGWFEHRFAVSQLVTPTANVRLRFVASDLGRPSIVEAAIDDVTVLEPDCDAEIERYGVGCTDGTARVLRLEHRGVFRMGGRADFRLADQGTMPAFLVVGASDQLWGGVPLPLNLAGIGAGGCWLSASPDIPAGTIPNGGWVSHPIPNNSSLAGLTAYWQAWLIDPAIRRPIPLATSDALRTKLGR